MIGYRFTQCFSLYLFTGINRLLLTHLFFFNQHLLNRLGLHKKLKEHTGCVNTVSFNADGDILVSGSDDRQVILWDWDTATVKLSFDSGHCDNIFQAKFMPFSDDRSIVTSSADGQVPTLSLFFFFA